MLASRTSQRIATRKIKQEPDESPPRNQEREAPKVRQLPKKSSPFKTLKDILPTTSRQVPLSETSSDDDSIDDIPKPAPSQSKRSVGKSPAVRGRAPFKGDDLYSARSKLTDVLTHISQGETREEDLDEDEQSESAQSPPHKIRRSKNAKKKAARDEQQQKQTCITRLFDRAVDLAPFCTGNTSDEVSLYPICREWIRNERPDDDLTSRLNADEVDDDRVIGAIYRLPNPAPVTAAEKAGRNPRVPKNTVRPTIDKELLDGAINSVDNVSQLLSQNVARWRTIRQDWHQASRENELRFKHSCDVLKSMYEKSISAQLAVETKQELAEYL